MGKTVTHSDVTPSITEDDHSFLKSARDIGFVLAVLLYLMGWVYVYYYLRDFGISIRQVDIDFYNLITYSIDVILFLATTIRNFIYMEWVWLLIVCVIIFANVFFIYRWFGIWISKNIGRIKRGLVVLRFDYVALIFIVAFSYIVAMKAAYYNKNRDQISGATKLHTIRFKFKEEVVKETSLKIKIKDTANVQTAVSNDLFDYNENGELRLLIADKETYYVFRFDPTVTWNDVGSIVYEVFIIQREDVQYAKISN